VPAAGDTAGALSYSGAPAQADATADPDAKPVHKAKKSKRHREGIAGIFESIGGFFKRLFGAE
jgi:hypothetical protein